MCLIHVYHYGFWSVKFNGKKTLIIPQEAVLLWLIIVAIWLHCSLKVFVSEYMGKGKSVFRETYILRF